MLNWAVILIGLTLLAIIFANDYCAYRVDEKTDDYKEKYYHEMEINKELLDELLKEAE